MWNLAREQWHLNKVEFLFPDNDPPFDADRPETAVEHRHGWIVPPEWEFVSEVREYDRKPSSEITYDHNSEVDLLGGNVPVIRE